MTVLMTYHKLVERDSKNIGCCWKIITIIFLVSSIVCCIIGSLSMNKLINSYDNHCILGAQLMFMSRTLDNSLDLDSPSNMSNTPFISNDPLYDRRREISNQQLEFMNDYKIDTRHTNWGSQTKCDFTIFIPIFQCCFGIILTVFFVICGRGGKATQNSFLPQPWRIVFIGFIFFLVMTGFSIANLTMIHKGLKVFCDGFKEKVPDVSCLSSINYFKLSDNIAIMPEIFYILSITFNWILLSCWTILLFIMIARIIFVIDFQLVRVTVRMSEFEDENLDENTNFEVKDSEEKNVDGNHLETATSQC